ncbi:MAG TPA: NAD(P)-dependent oxidoreductase [Blastocatellia bacterium]|nr:NAD(P)-dependent oxidoreductase [Blastocatellia bacterium]
MSKRFLVTGGSGYLGAHIKRYFAADDFSRRSGHDLTHPAELGRLSDYDVIIHLAGCTDKRPEAEERCFEVNVSGTANLLRSLRAGQIFILASTKDVYGRHCDDLESVDEQCPTNYANQNAYEWSKLIAEKYVQYYTARAGARSAIFRLSTTYAPSSEGNAGTFVNFFANAIRSGNKLTLKAGGQQVRDFLHVNDLAKAFELFINSDIESEIFNIGGGPSTQTTLLKLTDILGELIGRKPVVEINDQPETGQVKYVTNTNKLEKTLGWQPQVCLSEGLKSIL